MEEVKLLSVEQLIYAYAKGVFPMADEGEIHWYSPDPRAIIPIDSYKPAQSLRSVINKHLFEIRIDTAFEAVMRLCAAPRSSDSETWISEEIIQSYTALFHRGFAL